MTDETTPIPEVAPADTVAAAAEVAAEPVAHAGLRIKTRKPKQRACDERNEKGKLCAGHLKRWFDFPEEVAAVVGKGAEIYRCEFCKIIYRPDPRQQPNSYTVRY